MTALDELQAAHGRLMELRDADTTAAFADERGSALAETLHGTIDAQLAILSWGIGHLRRVAEFRSVASFFVTDDVLALARAINGGA